MGRMLNAVVEKYAESVNTESVESGDLFSAQKALEQAIVEEICQERAREIDEQAARLAEERDLFRIFEELKTLIVQCVLLALAIGILGTHIFEMIYSGIYLVDGTLDGVRIAVGFVAFLVLCVILVLWISYSKLSEFAKVIKGHQSQGSKR